jgi:hypothetical protein
MTVQEALDKLNEIPDKSLHLCNENDIVIDGMFECDSDNYSKMGRRRIVSVQPAKVWRHITEIEPNGD